MKKIQLWKFIYLFIILVIDRLSRRPQWNQIHIIFIGIYYK